MDYKTIFILNIFSLTVYQASCQFRLPSFDIGLKAGYLNLKENTHSADGEFEYESLFLQGDFNIHLGQHFAVGCFYNRGYGNYQNVSNKSISKKSEHLIYGLNLRLSAGRGLKFRPYIQAKYGWTEIVVDFKEDGYRLATDRNSASFGGGLMLKLNNKVYLNLIEAEATTLMGSGVLFNSNEIFPQLRTGLTYNFSKRK